MNARQDHKPLNATRFIASLTSETGLTLPEVMFAVLIFEIVFISIIGSLLLGGWRAEFSRYNMAAAKAVEERMERCRNAPWNFVTGVDQLVSSNFPNDSVLLDTYAGHGGALNASRTVTITTVTSGSTTNYRVIAVQAVWQYGRSKTITNTLVTIRSPDQ